MKRAVVLSGGGSKGSYQLGVWKALRRLHIKYDIVTGTSIGALNGALMTQKTYLLAHYIWRKLNLEYLFQETAKSNKDMDVFKLYGKQFIKQGGMNIEKIESIIDSCINQRKFYHSKIDFGLVTFNFTTKKHVSLTKEEIKKEQLKDYLMASATCYPAFQMKEIDGDKFLDGGFYDNLPINLALKMGADELIVVDLKAPGLKKRPKREKPTTYIAPNNKISFFLNFNKEQAVLNMKFGYNDTMKSFGKLDGKKFTFRKNSVTKYYQKQRIAVSEKKFLTFLENLGQNFELKEEKIYSMYSFLKALKQEVKKQDAITSELKKQIKSGSIKKITNTKALTLYFLSNLEQGKKESKALTTLFTNNYEQARFLYLIGAHYGK